MTPRTVVITGYQVIAREAWLVFALVRGRDVEAAGLDRELLAARRPSAIVLTCVSSACVLAMWVAAHMPEGREILDQVAGYRAWLPMHEALVRLPLSIFAPTLSLPVLGALAQVAAAAYFGALALGWRITCAVALVSHVLATLTTRELIGAGLEIPFRLPAAFGPVLDTGPSVATLSVALCIAVVLRLPVVATIAAGAMIWEVLADPNLAGREHLVGLAVGFVAGFAVLIWRASFEPATMRLGDDRTTAA